MSASDREKSLDSRRIDDLLAIVDGQAGNIPKAHALSTLLHKRMADKPELLERTLAISKDEALRMVALRGLGMSISELSRNVLVQRLPSLSIPEARVALTSIAKIGMVSELEALERYREDAPPALLSRIDAARRLIAFRHGIDALRIMPPLPIDIRRPEPGQGREMKTTLLDASVLRGYSRRIGEEIPGLDVSLESALEAVCLKQRIWILHSRKLESMEGAKNLLEREQIPMAIMGYAYCSDRPYLYAHVLSQPSNNGIELFVTRLNGVVTHYGKAELSGESLKFELSAVKTRFAPALRISGQFAITADRLTFADAFTSEDTREQARLARRPKQVDALQSEPVRTD